MSPTLQEAQQHNPSLAELEIEGLVRAAWASEISGRQPKGRLENRDSINGGFNLAIKKGESEIGLASVTTWNDEQAGEAVSIAVLEDIYIFDSFNNHSAYLALLSVVAQADEKTARIEGVPLNDMAAITLDLDTFNLLPPGWTAKYFREVAGELIELEYPFEVYDCIKDGVPVYHVLDRQ